MIEVVPLSFGVTFKKAFGQKEVFCQFVHDVLGISVDLNRIQIIQEYEYHPPVGYVGTQYDLFAEDTGQRIIVEIQRAWFEDFFDRFLHYHLCGIVEQSKSHDWYRIERAVYTIVVLTTVPRNRAIDFSMATGTMNPINESGQQLSVYPHKLVFLNPRLLNEKTPQSVREWLQLIGDSLKGQVDETRYPSPIMQAVLGKIKADRISPAELAKIKDEAAWEHARQNAVAEGKEVGKTEGMELGATQSKFAIAQNMLQKGLDIALIVEVTGLTAEQIRELPSQL